MSQMSRRHALAGTAGLAAMPAALPLLAALPAAAQDGWGVGDSSFWNGHGTMMAGVALYGDVEAALATGAPIALGHRLETFGRTRDHDEIGARPRRGAARPWHCRRTPPFRRQGRW